MFEKISKFLGFNKKSLPTGETLSMLKAGVDRPDIEYYEGWVYACVNKIAKGFAQVEWDLYQSKGKEVVSIEEHPLLSLLNRFNPKYTRYDSLELMAIYYTLYGRCPLLMIAEKGKKPTELWVLPPQFLTTATKDDDGYPTTYRYSYNGKSQIIDAGLVLDIRNPDPSNPALAFGLIKPIRPVADTDYFAKLWNKNLLINQAQPTGVVEVSGNIDNKEARQLRNMLEETYAGFENAHRLMILKNGATIKPFSLTPTDMDFSNGRMANRDEICAMFGVPKILLGLDSGYNRATAETAEMVFAKYTLQPMLTKIVDQINEFLTPLFGQGLWVDFDYLVPADKDFELKEREVGFGKWLTPNEIRRDIGLPELTGGDVIYGSIASIPLIGVGGAKGGKRDFELKLEKPNKGVSLLKQKKIGYRIKSRDYRLKQYGVNMAELFEQKITKLKLTDKKLTVKIGGEVKKKAQKTQLSDDQKLEYWYKTIELKRKLDGQWKQKMIGLFDKQKAKILANLDALQPFKGANVKATKKQLDELMFDFDEEVKTTISIIKPEYYNSLIVGANLASELVGEQAVDILAIPKCVDWLNYVADKYGEGMVETTRDDVYRIFQNSFADGSSNFAVQQQIETYFTDIGSYRAEMIARTESARSMTASQGFVWDTYGFTKVEWYAEPTACETCQGLSADDWTVEQAQSGTVEYSHPNCECRFLPIE